MTVCEGSLNTVPNGKRLVVEYIAAQGHYVTLSSSDPAPPVPYGNVFGTDSLIPFVFEQQLSLGLADGYFFSASDAVH